ncbi:MAG: heavy metal-responsive transcriptional regulator [Candidatus Paracaedimonas acanthamoebae]|uniref:Heavy metal-responsive transcriptional regulator n=1 Tax=Candidatus Paracaedimonas acanthamoebae TaxID=244581 RepID=A0A8J7PN14_9PROT|nr:heavy metal-responsive transcriptional regulator [Candidatus Paracaedimonas acanthamoebae]
MEYYIGQLAREIQVKTDTIRFYEKIGLMPKPLQSLNGYRYYSSEDLKRLKFIVRAKEMGFTLAEIKGLLNIKLSSEDTCDAVYAKSHHKIKLIDQKISELKKVKIALGKLMEKCHLEDHLQSECPILDALEAEE